MSDKSFSFSIPVKVIPYPSISCGNNNTKIDSSLCYQYLIRQCLESNIQSIPQFEI